VGALPLTWNAWRRLTTWALATIIVTACTWLSFQEWHAALRLDPHSGGMESVQTSPVTEGPTAAPSWWESALRLRAHRSADARASWSYREGKGWRVKFDIVARLPPGDPLIKRIRTNAGLFVQTLYGNLSDLTVEDNLSDPAVDDSGIIFLSLTQSSSKSGATVRAEETIADANGSPRVSVKLRKFSEFRTWPSSQFASWQVKVAGPKSRIMAVSSQPVRQDAHEVAFSPTSPSSGVTVDFDAPGRYRPAISQSSLPNVPPWMAPLVLLCAAVFFAVIRLTGPMINEYFPAATSRRWKTAMAVPVVVVSFLTFGLSFVPYQNLDLPGTRITSGFLFIFLWFVLPLAAYAAFIRVTTRRPPSAVSFAPLTLPPLVAVLAVYAGQVNWLPGHGALPLVWWIAAPLAVAVLMLRLSPPLERRWSPVAIWSAALLVPMVSLIAGMPNLLFSPDTLLRFFGSDTTMELSAGVGRILVAAALQWPWVYVFTVAIRHHLPPAHRRLIVSAAAAVFTVGLLPGDLFVGNSVDGSVVLFETYPWLASGSEIDVITGYFATLLILGLLVVVLIRMRAGSSQKAAWPYDIRTLSLCAGFLGLSWNLYWERPSFFLQGWRGPAYIILATLAVSWLFPPHLSHAAERLNRLSSQATARLVRQLIKSQALSAERRAFVRAPTTSATDPHAWQQTWSLLGDRRRRQGPAARDRRLRRAALGGGLDLAPWNRAVRGAVIATAVAAPWTFNYLREGLDTLEDLTLIRAFHWTLLGVIYGFSYPWVRGNTPLEKSSCLLLAITSCEALSIFSDDWSRSAFAAAAFSIGTAIVLCLVLGLAFEYTAVRRAGYLWRDVRSFRTLATLAAPSTAVLIAVATAFFTALAATYSTQLTPPPPPAPAVSTTAPSSPGAPSPAP
jgi:hypothetical protein